MWRTPTTGRSNQLGPKMTERRIRLQALGSKSDKDKKWEADRLVRIGRLANLEVVLDDASISRQHAEIAFTDNEWVARDLGSTNGTFLNGTRLGRTGQPARSGDILQCGNVVLGVAMMVGMLGFIAWREHAAAPPPPSMARPTAQTASP